MSSYVFKKRESGEVWEQYELLIIAMATKSLKKLAVIMQVSFGL